MSEGQSLEDLEGVGAVTAKRLRDAGIETLEDLAASPVKELQERTGVSEEKAIAITMKARELLHIDFLTANELMQRRKGVRRILTPSKNLNAILAGGFETQAITEIVGEFGTGKTQICMVLCAQVQQLPENGGLGGRALYIDTEGTFSPERLYQIAQNMGLDPALVLDNVIYARAYNSDHQMLMVEKAAKVIREKNVKLVVVDSVVSHFRGEYIGRGTLSERQQKLNSHIHRLLRLAETYNLAAVVTNQVIANPDTFFGDPNKPSGGHVLAHATTHRIFLRKSKQNTRVARIADSPYLPSDAEAMFRITSSGIEDAEIKE